MKKLLSMYRGELNIFRMFEPSRLILARKKRRLTQRALSEKIGVTALYYNLIEIGAKCPGPDTVEKIARTLDFPVDFFFQGEIEGVSPDAVSFRSFTKLTARERDSALAAGSIAALLTGYLNTEFNLPASDIPDLRDHDPESAAAVLRAEWGLGDKPIKNMTHLLEKHGARIFSLTRESRDVDAFCFWREATPVILVNTTKSMERVRFDLAHELGHLTLHRHGAMHGRIAETQADEFASAFLLPATGVLAKCQKANGLSSLISLKKNWGVSVAALNQRLFKLGMISEWHHRLFCIEISKNGYRTSEPDPMTPEFSQVLKKIVDLLKTESSSFRSIADELKVSWDDLKAILEGLAVLPIDGSGPHMDSRERPARPELKLV
jgi:Zn-dependent peptidase ImmA (M78 family)/DNA-binding XRE family transcriptional regulator